MKERISIIMPAYNEAVRIASAIEETTKAFAGFGYDWQLIVIDDGSQDSTYKNAAGLIDKYKGRLIVNKGSNNVGKGWAIKEALRYINGDYVVFLDADMDLHPMQFETFFNIMRLDGADIVVGSKFHPNSIVKYPLGRRIISLAYYILVRILFNLPCRDTQTGIKLFKVEVIKRVFPRILVKKFAFDLELLVNAHHLSFKIAEAPVVLSPQRRYGRIGLSAILITLQDTLAVFYRMYILRYYDRIDCNCSQIMEQ